MESAYDIIIVGAGLAGLRTGIETLKKYPHLRCCILEKYGYAGGRVFTFHKKIPGIGMVSWEAGAGRIYRHHLRVLDLLRVYGLHTIPIGSDVCYRSHTDTISQQNTFSKLIQAYLEPLRTLHPSLLAQHTIADLLHLTIGHESAKRFYVQFPYFSEIHTLRADVALDSFHSEMSSNTGFVVCKEGLSSLADAMRDEFRKRGGTILFNTCLKGIYNQNNMNELRCEVGDSTQSITTPIVVLALHHAALKTINGIRNYDALAYLTMEPLLRMYAIFPVKRGKSWFSDIPHTVTDSPIRYIIPIDPSRGTVMISYTDGDDAEYWIKQHKQDHQMKDRIMREIRRQFPEHVIPEPIFFKQHEWKSGCTYWIPGNYRVKEVSDESLHPMPTTFPGVFICGESFAEKQCWIESALEQADKLLHHPQYQTKCMKLSK
jgi:glycine/D-amino acid oxidase-like deaminating enzyme